MPTVARLPLEPMVNFAPRGPNERDPPDLLRFRVTPGAIRIRLQKRKNIRNVLLTFGWIRVPAICVLSLDRSVPFVDNDLPEFLVLRQLFSTLDRFRFRFVFTGSP